ncbi:MULTISPECIES: restriction endonuclease subunit S [unclassified Gilliamella]|uniref:restriction endonuclease subunit S n=1 Tax=unclassified Gilliamella TaxID=2685620 RepID=UPI0018DEA95F|nr:MULTISPECIES: restriction endonuclease subunit S [unclassified Gilliamella]MBI0113467.1 restriction endonuclease subunit S [Gilliamella sp. W8123]MBI0116996.1 restriction endonuclease subunit S [Gilliamella sp. W8129]
MNNVITASEYCFSVFDGTHDSPKQSQIGYPLITSKHLSNNSLDIKNSYLISELDYNAINKRSKVSQWDILFSMIGTVGEVYLEKNNDICYAIKNIGVFSCKDEDRAKWLYYYLKSPIAKKHIKRYLNGAVQKFLPLSALRDFPVFDFNQNSKLLTRLISFLDEKIIINNRINTELESMAKTLYDYWFVQFDFPNEEGKPYKSSGGKMVYNSTLKREIPEGWSVDRLKPYINFKRGISYKSNEISDIQGKEFLNLNSFSLKGEFKIEGTKHFIGKYNQESLVSSGGLVVAITDVTRNADIIGKAFIIPSIFEDGALISCDVVSVTSERLNKFYLEQLFNSTYYHSYIKYYASGTLVLHLNLNGINWFNTILPPVGLLNQFEKFCKPILKKKAVILKENKQLIELRDWLLPMLMNGQVTVK